MSLEILNTNEKIAGRVRVTPNRTFICFDAYKEVIDSGIDVVLLATPPHFRPEHLRYAVAAGKHAFVEKPVAVDAPGVKRVDDTTTHVDELVLGTKGTARMNKHRIEGEKKWRYRGSKPRMHLVEHKKLFKSIREGRPINIRHYGVRLAHFSSPVKLRMRLKWHRFVTL